MADEEAFPPGGPPDPARALPRAISEEYAQAHAAKAPRIERRQLSLPGYRVPGISPPAGGWQPGSLDLFIGRQLQIRIGPYATQMTLISYEIAEGGEALNLVVEGDVQVPDEEPG